MRYQTLLFDLDGTLTTSWQGIFGCIRHTLEAMEWPDMPDERRMRRFVGPPLRASFAQEMGMNEAQVDEAVRLFRVRYTQSGYQENAVFTGIPMLLRGLRAQGARLYVATAKVRETAIKVLEHFDLLPFFDGVYGPESDHMTMMTKGQIIERALRAAGGSAGAVMVGDRGSDIQGAKDNGIDSVAVGFGFHEEGEWERHPPTHYAEDVAALRDILLAGVPQGRGLFISVEGIDGSGKSTHLPRIAEYLAERGYDVRRTREPGGDPLAEKIRELLLDPANDSMHPETEALLYAASRAQHVREIIRPALAEGKLVLCDRYIDSSLAYQGAGRGLGVANIARINEMAMDGQAPDLTLLFLLDSAIAGKRLAQIGLADRIEREALPFFERVSEAYRALQAESPERIQIVDAGGMLEQTYAQAEAILRETLRRI